MIRIVADSACDIPAAWRAHFNIPLVYAYLNLDGKSYPDDGVALPHPDFYRRMAAGRALPTTSAPSPGQAQSVLRSALNDAEHVVVFTVASTLSSIYNSVRIAANAIDPEHITVVDTGSLSLGAGYRALAAAEVAAAGGALPDVLAAADAVRSRVEVWACINSLDHLRRSGRVNALMASLGTLLQVKPVVTVRDGVVTSVGRVRTMGKAIQFMAEKARECAPVSRLAFAHTHAPETAETLRQAVGDLGAGLPETPIFDTNAAFGVHFGQGTVGLILVRA